MTAYSHPRNDPEFAEQWEEAESHATDLIVSRAFQRALEGDCEPIFYKGKVVAHVRKFDTNVQIAVLRALRPDKFKTPGTQVNIGTKGDIFVLTEEQRHELQRINREWLESTPPLRAMHPVSLSAPTVTLCDFSEPNESSSPATTHMYRFVSIFRSSSVGFLTFSNTCFASSKSICPPLIRG